MPYPKTISEVQKAKKKLESDIRNLVEEFEFETATTVKSIFCYSKDYTPGRISTDILINALADEVRINATEVLA